MKNTVLDFSLNNEENVGDSGNLVVGGNFVVVVNVNDG
jgi:hypothetical protein